MNHGIIRREEPRYFFSLWHNKWVLCDEIAYRFHEHVIVVPPGYVTDLASIPFYIRPFIQSTGRTNEAATVHDWLYEFKGVITSSGKKLTRMECDEIFLRIMLRDGVSPLKAYAMFIGVVLWPFNYPPFKHW
jgi:hypothetical protein